MPIHTPGPWRATANLIQGHLESKFPSLRPTIALVATTTTSADANARLIAAAPDLLDALQWTWATLWETHEARYRCDTYDPDDECEAGGEHEGLSAARDVIEQATRE